MSLMLIAVLFAAEPEWKPLTGEGTLDAWKTPSSDWFYTDAVGIDPDNPRLLKAKAAKGNILVNGPKGRTKDLYTKGNYGDVNLHMEFFIPKGSNSGVKFHGVYEIQISDSHGKKDLTGSDCGGIYPRATFTPAYKHLDEGIAPRVNAAKPAGEWQTLDVEFLSPRFDDKGKKIANARINKAVLNGQTIHLDLELKHPTGNNWEKKETATGPLMLQADHGPVAFRNVRIQSRILPPEGKR